MDDQRVNIGASIVHRNILAIYFSGIIKSKWPDKMSKSLISLAMSIERTEHICEA